MSPDLEATSLIADLPHAIAVVMLNSRVNDKPSITIDNYGGAREVVRHLLDPGHGRIAFFCGPPNNADAEQRRRAYRAGVAQAGLTPIEIEGNFTEESGYEAAKQFIGLSPRPTAAFAANDAMAIDALAAFSEAGLRVPEDLAVVGFDDIPIARFLSPPLTTVKCRSDLGRRGFEILLHASNSQPRNVKLKTALVVRRSSGA